MLSMGDKSFKSVHTVVLIFIHMYSTCFMSFNQMPGTWLVACMRRFQDYFVCGVWVRVCVCMILYMISFVYRQYNCKAENKKLENNYLIL